MTKGRIVATGFGYGGNRLNLIVELISKEPKPRGMLSRHIFVKAP